MCVCVFERGCTWPKDVLQIPAFLLVARPSTCPVIISIIDIITMLKWRYSLRLWSMRLDADSHATHAQDRTLYNLTDTSLEERRQTLEKHFVSPRLSMITVCFSLWTFITHAIRRRFSHRGKRCSATNTSWWCWWLHKMSLLLDHIASVGRNSKCNTVILTHTLRGVVH